MKHYILLALGAAYPLFAFAAPFADLLARPDMLMAAYSITGLAFIGLGAYAPRRAARPICA